MKNTKATTCFHVILYIHSPVMGLFPHISVATMTTFPGTSLITQKINWGEKPPLAPCLAPTSQVQQLC